MGLLIISHANCRDGFGAAYLAQKYLDVDEVVFAHYGDNPPDVKGKDVIIVDFSYSPDVLMSMFYKANSFVVLDHHESAKAISALKFCVFDQDRSGVGLMEEYIRGWGITVHPSDSLLCRYIEDYDLWRFNEKATKAVCAALDSYSQDFSVWIELAWGEWADNKLSKEGVSILRYKDQQIKRLIDNNRQMIYLAGYYVPAVNTPLLVSEVAGALSVDHDFGIAWHQMSDGRFKYSLRGGKGEGICNLIAERYGGGGHKKAASFVVDYVVHEVEKPKSI